jgi:phosphatidylglycerophosphatase A
MTRGWNFPSIFAFFLTLFAVGWWAALEWSKNSREPDSQKIVIDEVLGYFVAMGAFPREPSILLIQFFLFRTFDVLKPSPIRELDRYGKRFQIGPMQSLGVILDDLLAGLFAWTLLALALRFTDLLLWLGISN